MLEQPTTKIRDDVLAAHLEGEAVLLDLETKRYYRLNETAARIWKGLEQSLAPDQITDILVAEFDVDPVTARAELDRALEGLRARGPVTGRSGRRRTWAGWPP